MVLDLLLYLAIAIVLTEILKPKTKIEDARPAGLGDFQLPTATEGRPHPIIFGRVLMKGPNLVWYGDLYQEAIVEKIKTGLFSSERFTKGFRYHLGMQFALCWGRETGVTIHGVRIGEKEASTSVLSAEGRFDINKPELFGGEGLGSGGVQATCDFYPGLSSQTVNAYLDDADRQRITTAATPTCPAYNQLCHLVVRQMTSADPSASDIGAYLGTTTNISAWEFDLSSFPATFSGQGVGQNKVGSNDCNPMNVIYEILTNKQWGMHEDPSDIDVGVGSSFLKASSTLLSEGNGFSLNNDRERECGEVIGEVLRQIDGYLFISPTTGKWTIQLARASDDVNWGYDIDTVPQFTDDVISDLKEFAPGSWEDTTNEVRVKFLKREDLYKETYAPAQNAANAIMLSGGSFTQPKGVPAIMTFPGVMSGGLANNLAHRELRAMSRPLKRATFEVNTMVFDVVLGGVIAWTDPRRGFTKVPMRVSKIEYGTLEDNTMTVTATEDVFRYAAAGFGDPDGTLWTPPSIALVAFPATEQLAFEAPRGMITRDPDFAGDANVGKIMVAARRQGSEVGFQALQRNSSGTPSGSYAEMLEVVGFMVVGELVSNLAAGTAIPTSTITVDATPDTQTAIETQFDDAATQSDLGVDLAHLILIGNEFMLVSSAVNNGGDVDLQDVYRGVLDSVQEDHSSGDKVYLLFVGAGISDTNIANTYNVDAQLRMRSASEVFSGSVTDISFTMAKRALRPYPPAAPLYNGTATIYGTPDLEGDGSGLNGVGFDVDLRRRRYDTGDELQELLADNSVSASTEHRVRVYVDPTGSNDLAYDSGWFSGAGVPSIPTQAEIVTYAAAGTEIRVQSESRHDIETETNLESRYPMVHDVTPTSTRTSQFYLGGGLSAGVGSSSYTAASSGTFTVNIGGAYSTSNVEYRLNAGTWTVVIAASGTSGTIAGVTASDTIELRHTVSEGPDPNFVEIEDPGTAKVAYGTFSA